LKGIEYYDIFKEWSVQMMTIVRKLLLLLLLAVEIIKGEIAISSSNYLTVSRLSLKSADVITLTPQGWLSRALKSVPVTNTNLRDKKVYEDGQRGSFKIDNSRYTLDI
jgi:hypothetical protein